MESTKLVRRYAEKADVALPYALRATAAANALKNEANIAKVQE